MIDTIIFDVGRVLVNFDWTERFNALGYDAATQQRLVSSLFHTQIWNEFDRSAVSDDELLEQFIAGAPEYADEIREIFTHVELMVSMYPYTMDWIRGLKQRGFKIYILSNYARTTYEKSQKDLAFLQLVDGALFSFDCCYIKPEPEIYQELLRRFPITAAHSVFIDDRIENLAAARAFGINTLHFATYEETSAQLEKLIEQPSL